MPKPKIAWYFCSGCYIFVAADMKLETCPSCDREMNTIEGIQYDIFTEPAPWIMNKRQTKHANHSQSEN